MAERANPGRIAAASALVAVEEGEHVEDALARLAPRREADRGLAWFLALGTLRRRGHVDAALRPHLRQPLDALDAPVRAVLRVGAFEKLYGRAPARAVVHEGVELARALGAGRAQGLVNAVLRRVEPPVELTRAEALDHPAWLVDRWSRRYGVEAAEAWLRQNAEEPPLVIVARGDAEALRTRWDAEGLGLRPVRLGDHDLPGVFRAEGAAGDVTSLPGFDEGAFWVQDPASVAAADLVEVEEGMRVLDVCAAPGGKAFRLAARGARVSAVDRSRERLRLLEASANRLHLPLEEIAVHDWEAGPRPDGRTWDAVLVDAPCTGLGTMRRHPDLRWRRHPDDARAMQDRQLRILEHAAVHVAPGGQLVYAVCSPEPEEGEEVVRRFLAAHPEFRLDEGFSTAPPAGDEDAFQGARMVRS